MKRGIFFTFEGMDGCGKSTQIEFLKEYLEEKGLPCLLTREPGGCPISEKIRALLLDVENCEMGAHTEALLYGASRAQHIDQVILPALEAGKIVLCDRYLDSSLAYQGAGRGLGMEKVLEINQYAVRRCMPDVTFFFDVGAEDAKYRRRKREAEDRLEQEDDAFHCRVYEGFCQAAERFPGRIVKLNVSGTKYETRDKLREIVERILKERGYGR